VRSLTFYYDFVCPYAYLASRRVEALARDTGVELAPVPILLGGVFRAIGAPDVPMQSVSPGKAEYMRRDIARAAEQAGVELHPPPSHPRRTVLALRAAIATGDDLMKASHALFDAYWRQGADLEDEAAVRAALEKVGLDGRRAVELASNADVKDKLRANTERAVSDGVFGVPAFVIDDGERRELFWGHDRMDHVRGELRPSPRSIRVYFDYASPFAYLASTQLAALAQRTGATIQLEPILLGGLFKSIGTPDVPLFEMSAAKRRYQLVELERWAARYGVPFKFPSRFPMNTVKALRLTMLCPAAKRTALVHALFAGLWAHDRDLADDRELQAIARGVEVDVEAIWPAMSEEGTKLALRRATDEARARGIFGVPTFVYEDAVFWGQDRIEDVVRFVGGPRIASISVER